ncbi:MAG: phosphopantothenoylcysteine decarboxylase [Candidatus Methylacidiphilales bacterium]
MTDGRMRILITTGPSYAPIDQVRRITNLATGHIGTLLSQRLLAEGHHVFLARGDGSTSPAPQSAPGLVVESFGTNDDLDELLKEWCYRHSFDAVFHAAALGDFRVKEIHMPKEPKIFNDKDMDAGDDFDSEKDTSIFDGDGEDAEAQAGAEDDDLHHHPEPDLPPHPTPEPALSMPAKIGSEVSVLHVVLTPAKKLLPRFRQRFGPQARIVGWKYELDGSREVAVREGYQQIETCASNASVVNGRAYGDGFGICLPGGVVQHCADKNALVDWLAEWLAKEKEGRQP